MFAEGTCRLLSTDSSSLLVCNNKGADIAYSAQQSCDGSSDHVSMQQGDKLHVGTNKHAVVQVLYHVCQQVLASKPTTLVEDIASLQQAQDLEVRDQHHILALQFRIGKKELLQSCLWQYDPQQL